MLPRGQATVLVALACAAACRAEPVRATARGSGFRADLASVAEGDLNHGYDAGQVARELWRLFGGGSGGALAGGAGGHALQRLRGESVHASAQSVAARAARHATLSENAALSLELNRQLVALPARQECACAHGSGWGVVRTARAQLQDEGGEQSGPTAPRAGGVGAGGCPCKSGLVAAVTRVLQHKLASLTEELGSRTSAALAMQRALVSMRLPEQLAGQLTYSLDASLAEQVCSVCTLHTHTLNTHAHVSLIHTRDTLAALLAASVADA